MFIKIYFDNIKDEADSNVNKCKPCFSNKFSNCDCKILLTENEEIINKNTKVESATVSLHLFDWGSEPYDKAKDPASRNNYLEVFTSS